MVHNLDCSLFVLRRAQMMTTQAERRNSCVRFPERA